MTFKGFLINYFSPVYVCLRLGHFIVAFIAWASSHSTNGPGNFGVIIALLFIFNGIRPWKTGASISIKGVNDKLDELNNKYK